MQERSIDCLSFGDALFLHLERAAAPLHVASLCMFEGELDLDTFVAYIESKLPLIPRYRQFVVPPPFGFGVPSWEFDPNFDTLNHVHEIKLKRGTKVELEGVAGKLLSSPLDRKRPLWDFTLITGLKSKQTAVMMRVHHCLADGISGVGLMSVLLDSNAIPAPLPKQRGIFEAPPPRNQPMLLLDGFVTTFFTAIERLLKVDSDLIKLAEQLAALSPRATLQDEEMAGANGSGSTPLSGLNGFLPEFATPTERLPFNTVCQGPQKFRWAEIPFAEIRAIKKAAGTSVNDVVLTLVAMAVRAYAASKGVAVNKRILRIVVPVNIRSKDAVAGLGNQITFLPITVPLGVRDPQALLTATHDRMEVLKTLRLAELIGLAGTMLGTIPTAAQAVLAPLVSQLPISLSNLICTNVPGPQTPLYIHGHKMLACYPYVPIGGEMGMNCAVLTYNNTAFFGFTGDAKAIPDLDRLPKFLMESFAELRKAMSARPAKKRVKPKRRAVAQVVPQTAGTEAEVPPEVTVKKPEPKPAQVPEKSMAAAASD